MSVLGCLLSLLVLLQYCHCQHYHHHHGLGYSYQYRVEDISQGLEFQAAEVSDGGVVEGEYSAVLPGGNRRDRALKR